jgi:CBS domain-containing protein
VIKGKDVESNKDHLAMQVLPIMIDSNINPHGTSVDPGHKTKVSISDSSEITLYAGENPNKPYNQKTYYDYDSFPESSGHSCLPWTDFTRDFTSLDLKIDK